MSNAYRSSMGASAVLPTGDAVEANVLAGKTFSNTQGTGKTGTMVNRGAVSQTIQPGGSYTIPEGYHNGSGTVSAVNGAIEVIDLLNTTQTSQITITKLSDLDNMTYEVKHSGAYSDNYLSITDAATPSKTITKGSSPCKIMIFETDGGVDTPTEMSGTTYSTSNTRTCVVVLPA